MFILSAANSGPTRFFILVIARAAVVSIYFQRVSVPPADVAAMASAFDLIMHVNSHINASNAIKRFLE